MSLNPKVSETLNRIVELFRTGNVPQAISIATFPPFDVPSCAGTAEHGGYVVGKGDPFNFQFGAYSLRRSRRRCVRCPTQN